jgi:hypothetical protein
MTVPTTILRALRPTRWKVVFSILASAAPYFAVNTSLAKSCYAMRIRCAPCQDGPFPGFLLYGCCCHFGRTSAAGFLLQLAVLLAPGVLLYALVSARQARKATAAG